MKNLITIAGVLLFATVAMAQTEASPHSLSLQYNDTWVGKNVNLTYGYTFAESWRAYGGLFYHINGGLYRASIKPIEKGTAGEHLIFYQPHIDVFIHRFGFKAGVEKTLRINAQACVLFFYDFQYLPGYVLEMGGAGINWQNNMVPITPFPSYGGEIKHCQQHTLGTGLSVKVTQQFAVRLQAGVGAVKNKVGEHTAMWVNQEIVPVEWTLTRMIGMGVDYHFKARKPGTGSSRR
jgi:hypothetical protein